MANHQNTLRSILTRAKPEVLVNSPRAQNTKNGAWPTVQGRVTLWDDFNLTNLNESYGQVLDFPIPGGLLTPPMPSDVLTKAPSINASEDIRHLTSWNKHIIQSTVGFAKRHLGVEPGIGLIHLATTPTSKAHPKVLDRVLSKADHLIMLDNSRPLVVGLGRQTRWSGGTLEQQLPNPDHQYLWPVRQLAEICRAGQTRYGYTQTTEELLVCRFSSVAEPDNVPSIMSVAIKAVPWSRSGLHALTTDLALWWLCMLALSGEHHRTLTQEENMVSIGSWDKIRLDDGSDWVRRHQYSQIEIPASPPLLPAYQTPSPGNIAAFEAGAGIHARNDFDMFLCDPYDAIPATVAGCSSSMSDPNGENAVGGEEFDIGQYLNLGDIHHEHGTLGFGDVSHLASGHNTVNPG